MKITDIRNYFKVINSKLAAINTAHDVRRFDFQCKDEKQSWQIELHFTEKAFETFKKELTDITDRFDTYKGYPLSEDNPVFKGCETDVVKLIVIAGDYRTKNDKQSLFIGEKFTYRYIKAGKEYYSVMRYERNGYGLYFAVYSSLYNAYANKITFPKRPNLVNVMTPKKLESWINYLNKVNQLLEQKKVEIETKIANFKKKLKSLDPKLVDEPYGHIEKNGIKYSWNLDSNGNPNDKLEINIPLNCTYSRVDLFKMLSNNKFVSQTRK